MGESEDDETVPDTPERASIAEAEGGTTSGTAPQDAGKVAAQDGSQPALKDLLGYADDEDDDAAGADTAVDDRTGGERGAAGESAGVADGLEIETEEAKVE